MSFVRHLPVLGALLVGACAPSTPEARIAAHPGLYEGLDEDQRELVRQGRIARGMSTSAVFLAWGRASSEFQGADERSSTLRWDYTGRRPVHTTTHTFGLGPRYYGGYGRWGRCHPYGGFAVAPQVTYVPYLRASVWFRDGLVTRWERRRP